MCDPENVQGSNAVSGRLLVKALYQFDVQSDYMKTDSWYLLLRLCPEQTDFNIFAVKGLCRHFLKPVLCLHYFKTSLMPPLFENLSIQALFENLSIPALFKTFLIILPGTIESLS